MTYKLTNFNSVVRMSDNAFIPFDPANTDYAEYQVWLSEGNVPEPADVIVATYSVPSSVSRFQAMAALLQAGLLPDVETYMAKPDTDPFMVLAWKEAQDFRRDNPIVLSLGTILGLTEAQLDDLFKFASTITG